MSSLFDRILCLDVRIKNDTCRRKSDKRHVFSAITGDLQIVDLVLFIHPL